MNFLSRITGLIAFFLIPSLFGIAQEKEQYVILISVDGFSPEYKDMHGIFFANRPMVKEGLLISSFENIHVYPLLATILGLPIPDDIDGKLEVLEPILKEK